MPSEGSQTQMGYIMYDSTYLKYPEQRNPHRQSSGGQRTRGKGQQNDYLISMGLLLCCENVLELYIFVWSHNTADLLNATGFLHFKGVNFMRILPQAIFLKEARNLMRKKDE